MQIKPVSPKRDVKVTVYFDEETYTRLFTEATKKGISLSSLINLYVNAE